MTLSIRTNICLALSAFVLFCAVTLAAIMMGGFNPYYYQIKKQIMVESSREVSQYYEEKGEEGFEDIDQISQRTGSDIYIVENGKLIYSSRPDRRIITKMPAPPSEDVVTATNSVKKDGQAVLPVKVMQPPRHISEMMDLMQGREPSEDELGQVAFHETGGHVQLLDMVSRMHDKTYLIISQPVAPIEEMAQIAKRFALICGALWLVVAILGSLYISRRLTRPLLKLQGQSHRMTQLDFSTKWDEKRRDEIGQLGTSLNQLSEQLDTALTQLRESNAQLHKQLDKANEVEHMRKEFISSVSHELKTPLAIIQGYAEGLDSLATDEETRQRYCRVIRNETEKMDRLVLDLLNLSRLETGSFRIEMTDFDFIALVEDMQERFAKSIEEKGIRMEWNLPEEMLVNGDPQRVGQILGNYLSNAIDYTGRDERICVYAEDEGDVYKINVYNHGIQIAPEDQQRLWTAFYKVDSSRQRTFGGHGLGLSIVAALVKLHGQQYGMHNAADGVVFWFTIAKA